MKDTKIINKLKINKILLGVLFFSLLMPLNMFAYNSSRHTIEIITNTIDVSDSDISYITSSVKGKFRELIGEYTNLEVVDEIIQKEITKLQRKYEGETFTPEFRNEVIELSTADYVLFLNIFHRKGSYYLSFDVSNLKTGKVITKTSENVNEIDELYQNSGSPTHQLVIKLCEIPEMNSTLNDYQLKALEFGENSLTEEDRIRNAQEQEKEIRRQREELLKLKNDSSTSLQNDVEKQKLEAELELLAIKEKRNAEKQEKLFKEKERADKARERLESKSEESLARSLKRQQELEKMEEEILSMQMTSKSLVGQIKVIENRKRTLIELSNSIDDEKEMLAYEAQLEKEDAYENIFSAPLSKHFAEEEQIKKRNITYEREVQRINKQLEKDLNEIETIIKYKEIDMLNKITKDYSYLGKRTANSLTKELYVSYSAWDRDHKCWFAYITFESDGFVLFNEVIPLSYKTVTGKNPIDYSIASEEESIDYAETIDLYENLLLSGAPLFTFELEYEVLPKDRNEPSTYAFTTKALSFYQTPTIKIDDEGNITSGKKTKIDFPNKYRVFAFSPKYSLSSYPTALWTYPPKGNEKRTLATFTAGSDFLGLGSGCTIGGELSYGITHNIFASIGFGGLIPYGFEYINPCLTTKISRQSKIMGGWYFNAQGGYNFIFDIGPLAIDAFIAAGVEVKGIGATLPDKEKASMNIFAPRVTIGIDVPIFDKFAITSSASCNWTKETGIGVEANVGFSYIIPQFYIFK